MKKVLSLALALVMFFTLAACGGSSHVGDNANGVDYMSNDLRNEQTEQADTPDNLTNTNSNSVDAEEVRIKLSFNNEEVVVNMHDNPASRDFLSLLPLTLTLEDYARTEKVSNLPRRLSTTGAPAGMDPSVGDFTYYSPWGNIAIFYKDFGYSSGLIPIGSIESGIEKLASVKGNFIVTIERMD